MGQYLSLDVVDRPPAGIRRSMHALRSLRHDGPDGLRAVLQFGTARFSPRVVPKPTLRRFGTILIWDSAEDAADWERIVAPLCHGAREHWHVAGEIVRASFSEPWRGWVPDTGDAQPLGDDEPALILISGQLKARFVPAFSTDAAKAVKHAFAQPGYLGGLAINSSPLNTTSCSAWRSYADAKAYAFKPGGHATAMKRDRQAERHSTEWFLRIRPLAERGTLNGQSPFRDLLRPAVAA